MSSTIVQKYCDRARIVVLRHKGKLIPSKLFVLRCNDWRRCEVCARARAAKQYGRLKDLEKALSMTNISSYRPVMITVTLDRRYGQRYGLEGRRNLAKAINRINTKLSRMLRYPWLIKVRATEHHRNGAWHSHICLVMDKRDSICTQALTLASGLGFVGVTYPTESGTTRSPATGETSPERILSAVRYIFKYVLSIEKDHHARAFHVKGTRYFSWSLKPFLRNIVSSMRSWKRAPPIYERFAISKLTGRLEAWRQLRSTFGLQYHSWLASWQGQAPPYIHLNSDGSATLCRIC